MVWAFNKSYIFYHKFSQFECSADSLNPQNAEFKQIETWILIVPHKNA